MSEETTNTTTHAEKMLAAIEAVLENRATGEEYKILKINNREITKHTFDELTRLRSYYRSELARIKARKNKTFKNIGYRF
jgi:hypothetical protein